MEGTGWRWPISSGVGLDAEATSPGVFSWSLYPISISDIDGLIESAAFHIWRHVVVVLGANG